MLRNAEFKLTKRPERGQKCWQRLDLAIYSLNRWTVKCLEMSRKRGVQTDKTPRARTEVLAAPWVRYPFPERLGPQLVEKKSEKRGVQAYVPHISRELLTVSSCSPRDI